MKKFLFIAFIISAVVGCSKTTPPNTALNANTPTAVSQNSNSQITNAQKGERNSKLQSQADSLLYLFDRMPPVPVYLIDEPVKKGGTNTENGVAYTDCGKNKSPTMYMKKAFYGKGNQKQIVNILKHELTHAWQCRRGGMRGHDVEFRKKFTEAGGFGN